MKSIKLNDLMSVEDVKRFGKGCRFEATFTPNQVKLLFNDKYSYKLYKDYTRDMLKNYYAKYPAISYLKDSYICNVEGIPVQLSDDDEHHLQVTQIKSNIIIHFINYYYNKYKKNNGVHSPDFLNYEVTDYDPFFAKAFDYLKEMHSVVCNLANILEQKIDETTLRFGVRNELTIQTLKEVRQDRKALRFIINNIDDLILDYKSIKDEFFLNHVNIDKLELAIASGVCHILDSDQDEEISEKDQAMAICFLQKYFTLTEYLAKRAGVPYEVNISFQNSQDTYEKLVGWYNLVKEEKKDLFIKYQYDWNIEDILNTELLDARKKIRREDIENNLQVGWEIIPHGNRENNQILAKGNGKHQNPSSIDYETRDLELLEEKKAFYPNTDYLYSLNGREAYEGYSGFVYKNGLVVLDKFYSKKKDELIPTHNEGFVVMHILDLIEMSKYTKTELMDLIREGKNKSVQRKYHTSNWKERVLEIINKPADDYNFEEINEIIEDVLLKAINQDSTLKK